MWPAQSPAAVSRPTRHAGRCGSGCGGRRHFFRGRTSAPMLTTAPPHSTPRLWRSGSLRLTSRLLDWYVVEQRAGLARRRPLDGQERAHHNRVVAGRVAQAGGRGVGKRRAPAMGDDLQPARGHRRPVHQIHPPACEVAPAAPSLHQVIGLTWVTHMVAVADIAADPLPDPRGRTHHRNDQRRLRSRCPGRKAQQRAASLAVNPAAPVLMQAKLDHGGIHIGVEHDPPDAGCALVARAQRPRRQELPRNTAPQRGSSTSTCPTSRYGPQRRPAGTWIERSTSARSNWPASWGCGWTSAASPPPRRLHPASATGDGRRTGCRPPRPAVWATRMFGGGLLYLEGLLESGPAVIWAWGCRGRPGAPEPAQSLDRLQQPALDVGEQLGQRLPDRVTRLPQPPSAAQPAAQSVRSSAASRSGSASRLRSLTRSRRTSRRPLRASVNG